MRNRYIVLITAIAFIYACNNATEQAIAKNDTISCESGMPSRFGVLADTPDFIATQVSLEGMIKIPGGEFMMGASDDEGRPDEYPQHKVKLDGFWMDITEVTNAQFKKFTVATGYVTTAEKKPDWEEIKKQLPAGTPKPDESKLVASSLVFTPPGHPSSLMDASEWWTWTQGANWKHPQGPKSNIEGKDDFPVVHISWDDAMAYCKWSGKR